MLVLPTQLTHRDATACLHMLVQGLRSQPDAVVVADATALATFDSSALAVLLECRRHAHAAGKTFGVKQLHPRLRGLAALYGVGELLPATP
ncbi:MAG: STAS domain-containing protein [Burkholderiales bacterium]|nr:STAS domain-containing protein [Burkholderiales bacterium]